MQEARSKINAFARRHQQYYRQAVGPKEPELLKMKTRGISVYPEAFKKAELPKKLLDSIDRRGHNNRAQHTSAAPPMDTHSTSIKKEKSHGESEEHEDKPDEDHCSEQHGNQTWKAGPHASSEQLRRVADHEETSEHR